MKKIKFFTLLLSAFIGLSSCEDYLDVKNKGSLAEANVFETEAGADMLLNTAYVQLPNPEQGGLTYDSWEFMSPFHVCRYNWGMTSRLYGTYAYSASVYNPGLYNHMYPSMWFMYDFLIEYIRNCNLFIENIEKYKSNYSEEWFVKRTAEAKCLRAFYYHYIWTWYGGTPYITETLKQEMGDDMFRPANSQEEIYTYMCKDLEEAAQVLPNEQGEGRFTKGAALVLKAWIQLYWGDIIHDPRPATIFPADDEKAKAAYAACAADCKLIMEQLGNTYGLMENREDAFMEKNNNCKEQIFSFQTTPTSAHHSMRSKWFGPYNTTTGRTGDFITTGSPTPLMVDMYAMKDGRYIDDEGSTYDPEHPYENREPRFYADIVYHGSKFCNEVYSLNPGPGEQALIPGTDCWYTGYCRRKGINESLSFQQLEEEACTFNYFRYAEVLLMYAEARIKGARLGGPAVDQSVIDALDQVRTRSAKEGLGGLPTLKETYGEGIVNDLEQLEKIIWHERIVELSFEFKSYNDCRRNRRSDLFAKPKMALHWDYENNQPKLEKLTDGMATFPEHLYLMPLYKDWIEQNPAWIDPNKQVDGRTNGQNPGW